MSKQVITFVADANYLDHAKAMMVNCRRQGEWEGDFCLIAPGSCHHADLEDRRICVLHVKDKDWDFMVKFYAFTPYFHQWDQALCIDLDVIVQAKLHPMFDALAIRLPKILCDLEDGSILAGLKYWDEQKGDGPEAHPEVYEAIEARYPHVTQRMFNMAFIFYEPASMPPETMDELRVIHEEFKVANPSNADQMLVNLHLYDRLAEAGKDYCTFFGNDDPGSRVASEGRGWRGDEVPVILHYTRWHAPWVVKQAWQSEWGMTPQQQRDLDTLGLEPEVGGYRNHRLNRICHAFYAENLAAFEEVFPRE